jgi:hypothetical protein
VSSHRLRVGLSALRIYLQQVNALNRFDNALSSRAIGEGSAVDRFESGDRRGFPAGV